MLRLSISALLFCWATSVFAQLSGTVSDLSSGQALPDQLVKIKAHQSNKVLYEMLTDSIGNFEFQHIPDGLYDIECKAKQYIGKRIVGLTLSASKPRQIAIQLHKGNGEIEQIFSHSSLQTQLQRPVTTASLLSDALINAPATIYVITHEDIEQRGYFSLAEVLQDIPEIEVQDRANYYTHNLFSVRGVHGAKRFILLLDGVRISSFTAAEMPLDKNISIANAEQIEVLLGPAAALYGADAMGGVINIIRKKPESTEVQATTSYGSYHTSENALRLGFLQEDFSITANGGAYLSQEPNLPNFYADDFQWYWNRYQTQGVMHAYGDTSDLHQFPIRRYQTPRYAYWADAQLRYKGWELGFQRNWQRHNMAIASESGLTLAVPEFAIAYASTNAYISHRTSSENRRWQLTSLLNWNWNELSPRNQFADSYNQFDTLHYYASGHTWQHNEVLTLNLHEQHQLQAGLNTSFSYEVPTWGRIFPEQWKRGQLQQPYYPGSQTTWIDGRDTQLLQSIRPAYLLDLGIFLQYKTHIADKLWITLGARFDYFMRREKSYPTFNPRLGITYRPHKNWAFKAFYGEAFASPSMETLYADYTSIGLVTDSLSGRSIGYTSDYAFMPNPQLLPEKMRSGEIGLIFARDNWVAALDGYINYLSNTIELRAILDTTYLNMPVSYGEQYQNGGQQLAFGGTARLEYRLLFGEQERGELRFRVAYSFSDGRITDLEGTTENLLPYSAQHTVKGGIFFRYQQFRLDARCVYRSRTYDSGIYDENDQFIRRYNDPYIVLNLHAAYRILPKTARGFHFDLFVKVNNATNARYYNAATNFNDTMFASPQAPIQILGGLRFMLGKQLR